MRAATLKECPHCGSEAELDDCSTAWAVRCTSITCWACVIGERAPEPDGSESDEFWAGIKQTAIDRWNARAIAPPVAAGSVDTLTRFECLERYGEPDMVEDADGDYVRHADAIAWGAQQREAGSVAGRRDQYQVAIDQRNRAEKAEADLAAEHQALLATEETVVRWRDRAEKAEARVKELETQLAAAKPYDLKA